MGWPAGEVQVLALVPVACPAGITLVASCPTRRDLVSHSDVDKLVQLGGALTLKLREVCPIDCTRAFRRDPVEEATIDATASLLSKGLLGYREPATIARPLVEVL